MQSIRWLGFSVTNSLTKSIVHFYPSSGSVTAPYQASCSLTVFGNGVERKRVVLEGARLSHPDGVRLDLAFPTLKGEGAGLHALEIEVTTTQPRVDLAPSSCVIELCSKGATARYSPRVIEPKEAAREFSPGLAIRDSLTISSVVIVNGTESIHKPEIKSMLARRSEAPTVEDASLGRVAPGAIMEVPFEEAFMGSLEPHQCSWGAVRSRGVWTDTELPAEVGYFVMYRDAVNKLPLSVWRL